MAFVPYLWRMYYTVHKPGFFKFSWWLLMEIFFLIFFNVNASEIAILLPSNEYILKCSCLIPTFIWLHLCWWLHLLLIQLLQLNLVPALTVTISSHNCPPKPVYNEIHSPIFSCCVTTLFSLQYSTIRRSSLNVCNRWRPYHIQYQANLPNLFFAS